MTRNVNRRTFQNLPIKAFRLLDVNHPKVFPQVGKQTGTKAQLPMTALGHFQPLSIQPGERLDSARSGHWWTAELRFGIYLSERPRSLDKMDRHKPAIQLRCRIAVSNQYFSNSLPIFTTSLSRSWICCRSEVISWSEKGFSGGSPSIMILV